MLSHFAFTYWKNAKCFFYGWSYSFVICTTTATRSRNHCIINNVATKVKHESDNFITICTICLILFVFHWIEFHPTATVQMQCAASFNCSLNFWNRNEYYGRTNMEDRYEFVFCFFFQWNDSNNTHTHRHMGARTTHNSLMAPPTHFFSTLNLIRSQQIKNWTEQQQRAIEQHKKKKTADLAQTDRKMRFV